MIRVIVFDLDDTLYPERHYVRSGFMAVSLYMNKVWGIPDFFQLTWERYIRGERKKIFDRAIRECGISDSAELIGSLVHIYRSHMPDIILYQDAVWALEKYSEKVLLALISDGYLEAQRKKAKALGISKYFQVMYFTDEWGKSFWKPNPFVFRKLEKELNVTGNECVYISDNPTKDFIAPNELGWQSIQVVRSDGEYAKARIPKNGRPLMQINSLTYLEEVLDLGEVH
jgi:putative hydrolase of the HAD superfamily